MQKYFSRRTFTRRLIHRDWSASKHRSLRIACLRHPGPATPANPTTGTWWTGKDSNLHSPQGAADLQSAGFSHSPTRPGRISTGYESSKSHETPVGVLSLP